MNKRVLLLVFILFIFGLLRAQETTISGTVQLDDGTKLPGVNIAIKGTGISTVSDENGKFLLRNAPSGIVTIIASLPGFETETKTIFVAAGTMTVVTIVLRPAKMEEEIQVIAELPLLTVPNKISEVALTPTQITSLPSLGAQDIFRAFQLLPGVSGSNEASSGLYIRGGTPDQNLILYDGFTIYHVDHLFGYFSIFNMKALEEARLMKGGFEAKYGGRLSSVLELSGKKGNAGQWRASGGASLLSFDGHAEGPLMGKGSIFIAGRRSFQSPLYEKIMNMFRQNPILQGRPIGPGGGRGIFSQFEVQPRSYFYDINAKASFNLSSKDEFSFSLYNGKDNLDNSRTQEMSPPRFFQSGASISFKSDISDLRKWGNTGIAALNWIRRWNNFSQSNLIFSYSNYFDIQDRASRVKISRTDPETAEVFEINREAGLVEKNNLYDFSVRFDNEIWLGRKHQLGFGLQATSIRIKYDYETSNENLSQTPVRWFGNISSQSMSLQRLLERDDRGNVFEAYLQDRWAPFPPLTLTPGLRISYFDLTKKIYYDPRLSLSLNIFGPIRLKAAWGKYHQFVSRVTREDVLRGNREFWALSGTTNVPAGSAIHNVIGISIEDPTFLIDFEGYYKKLSGLSELAIRFRTPREGSNYNQFIYNGTGTAKGLETLIQKKYGSYTGWLSYTISRVEYFFPDLSSKPFPANHDQTHEIKLVNSYQWKKWTFAATWIYATGKPYTPLAGVENVTIGERTIERPIMGEKNSGRLPDYHRLDLAATFRFPVDKYQALAGLTLFNVYNRKNVWYKEFEIMAGELVENDFHYMGLTVNIFFDIRF